MKSNADPDRHREGLEGAKRLYLLKKHRSPHTVEFIEDPDDSWFVYVAKIKNTTKKFESFTMIIAKDVENFLDSHVRDGWTIEKTS